MADFKQTKGDTLKQDPSVSVSWDPKRTQEENRLVAVIEFDRFDNKSQEVAIAAAKAIDSGGEKNLKVVLRGVDKNPPPEESYHDRWVRQQTGDPHEGHG